MTDPRQNELRAEAVVRAAARHGVRTWCVAPGGRNAPLVAVLERARGVELVSHFDERAAGFFALGRSRRDGLPVAVTTTSGTAAAELLPSAIEGHYSGVPILFVTADRPKRLRGTGAPQAIEQAHLLAPFAPMLVDSDVDDAVDRPPFRRDGPTHWNVAFDEPLFPEGPWEESAGVAPIPDGRPAQDLDDTQPDSSAELDAFAEALRGARRPLVVVGPLDEADVESVCSFLLRLGAPVHAEAPSGLRTDPRIASLQLIGGDRSIGEVAGRADLVVRVGDIPTARLWRDVCAPSWSKPVISLSRRPFSGRIGGIHAAVLSLAKALRSVEPGRREWSHEVHERDRAWARAIDRLLDAHPRSEPAMIRALSGLASGLVYLGNSLPVREWDAFSRRQGDGQRIAASRGANGIDGQLSTFLGLCRPDEDSWAVIGDLTALYDLGAPWVLDRIQTGPLRIVVINNGGGRIFDRVFPERSAGGAFRNAHSRSFEAWASMWSIPYMAYSEVPDAVSLPDRVVLELRPHEATTAVFWRELSRAVP